MAAAIACIGWRAQKEDSRQDAMPPALLAGLALEATGKG
jgi:hypothetical protein